MAHSSLIRICALIFLAAGFAAKSPAPIPVHGNGVRMERVLSESEREKQQQFSGVKGEVGNVQLDQSHADDRRAVSESDAKDVMSRAELHRDEERAAQVLHVAAGAIGKEEPSSPGNKLFLGFVMTCLGVLAAFGVKRWIDCAIPMPQSEARKLQW